MKVFTQSVNFNADKKLIIYADEKVLGLVKYHDKIVDAEVFLKVLNISDKENKLTEIKINIPGSELNLKRQLKRSKEKHRDSIIS
jgi:putative sigma-54 modulation protein